MSAGGKHIRALDGLRGIAIILVLLRHVGEDGPARQLGGVIAAALQSGWLGVDVFFVLSGFLITGILLDARGEGDRAPDGYFLHFYARRALRIFPLYYLFVALLAPNKTWWYWTYLTNVMIARHGWPQGTPDTGHLWSLAVEEQFYLVWPTIIAFTPRRRFPLLCCSVVLSSFTLRALLVHQGQALAGYVLTPARADTLAVGAFLAVALRGETLRHVVTRATPVVTWTALAALGVLFVTHGLDHRLSVGGLLLGSAAMTLFTATCIVRVANGSRIGRLLEWGPLVSFGTYSYAIYLVQLPIRDVLRPHMSSLAPRAGVAAELVLLAGISWCIAWVSWRLIERPLLSLKGYVPMPLVVQGAHRQVDGGPREPAPLV